MGGGGNDTLLGGAGTDTADYSAVRGAVLLNLGAGLTTQDGLGGHDTLLEVEAAKGSVHNDKLIGSATGNSLFGQEGADLLIGAGGDDTLDGGGGHDTLIGGAGADTLTGSTGNDRFVLTLGMQGETVTDFSRGQDKLDVSAFAVTADWDALRARITYSEGDARIDFGGGDELTLLSIALDGLTAADFIGIGAGGERWLGTPGDDVHVGTDFDDVLDGLAGNDTLDGGVGNDVVVGDAGGSTGGDILRGGAGDDVLEGNAGDDTLDGGAGADTADYSRATGSVGVDLSAGVAADDGDLGSDVLIDIENVLGSPSSDYVIGSAANNVIRGATGNDVLKGLAGDDHLDGGTEADTLEGGAGDDTLLGEGGEDALYGGEGDDRLDGGALYDTLVGGTGDDVYVTDYESHFVGSSGTSYFYIYETPTENPREGTDRVIFVRGGEYSLPDSIENLGVEEGVSSATLNGNALGNIITGNDFNNLIRGLGGADHLIGNAGNDTLLGDGEGTDSGAVWLGNAALGIGGLQLRGEAAGDGTGSSLAAVGDINGDGRIDVAIGANRDDAAGLDAGAVYVVWGPSAADWRIDLGEVAAGRGLKIVGEAAGDLAGSSVAGIGDVNGDGRGDLLIGAYENDAGGTGAGAAYVVYGRDNAGTIELSDVAAGVGGFKITGERAGGQVGQQVHAAGDVNGDGRGDLLIGAYGDEEGGVGRAGAAYVVYGRESWGAVNLDDIAAGVGGFKIVGEATHQADTGSALAAGDINGDGLSDLVVGALRDSTEGAQNAGAAYVVFGTSSAPAKVQLSDVAAGLGGFKIVGPAQWAAGGAVAVSDDINGDGLPELLVGAGGAQGQATFVVYGKADTAKVLLEEIPGGDGARGYAIRGGGPGGGGGGAGSVVAGIGDLNGDGRGDVLVGAAHASFVVYGQTVQTNVLLSDVGAGAGGFRIDRVAGVYPAGVAAGDLDGDGRPDLLFSSTEVSDTSRGAGYVLFGSGLLGVRGNDVIEGGEGDDTLVGGGGNDILNGGTGGDVLNGGEGDDTLNPGTGIDQVDGGLGTDELVVDWSFLTPVSPSEGIITELFDSSGEQVTDPALAVEWVLRTEGSDEIVSARNVERFNISGTEGDDLLVAGNIGSVLIGGGGNDTLFVGARADTLSGGPGNDIFQGSAIQFAGDTILGIAGGDRIRFTDGIPESAIVTYSTESLIVELIGLPPIVLNIPNSVPNSDPCLEIDRESGEITVDEDCAPEVEVSISPPVAKDEGNAGWTPFEFTVTRTGNTGDLLVGWRVEGQGESAANDEDFGGGELPSGIIYLPSDDPLPQKLTVFVQGDTIPEPNEGFNVILEEGLGFVLDGAEASGVILNDDDRTLSIGSDLSQPEGTDTSDPITLTEFKFSVMRSDSESLLLVPFAVTPGPLEPPADGTDSPDLPSVGLVVFQPGEDTALIRVNVRPDSSIEPNETFLVTLEETEGWTFSDRQAIGTIEDDDAQHVSIVGGVSRSEGSDGGITPFVFKVTRSNSNGALDLPYGVTPGPTGPADMGDIPGLSYSRNLHFDDGQSSSTIAVGIARDNQREANETFFVTLGDPGTGLTFGNRQAIGTIINDDVDLPPFPRPVFRGDPHLVTFDGLAYDFQAAGEFVLVEGAEGSGVLVQARTQPFGDAVSNITAVAALADGHRVTIDARVNDPLRVDGLVTVIPDETGFISLGDATLTKDGSTYTLIDADGVTFIVDLLEDRLDLHLTGHERLVGSVKGLLGNFNDDTGDDLILRDGTILPTPIPFADLYGRFADAWRVTSENSLFDYPVGETTETYTDRTFPRQYVTLDMLPALIVARATELVDQAGITDPVARSAAILDYAITGDISFLNSAAIPIQVNAEVEVIDAPAPLPLISVASATPTQLEGTGGLTHFEFNIYRSGDTAGVLEVRYQVALMGDNPADLMDFGGALPSGTLTLPDGQDHATVSIAVLGDLGAEQNEKFALRISVADDEVGTVLIAVPTAFATIENDDGDVPSRLDVRAMNAMLDESVGTFVFNVVRTESTTETTTLQYAVIGSGRYAANASDFVGDAFPMGTITFAPGEISKTVEVAIGSDTSPERNEEFTFTLLNPTNAVIGSGVVTGLILNDDTSSPVTAQEGELINHLVQIGPPDGDPRQVTIEWGDSTPDSVFLSNTQFITLSHIFADDGIFAADVSVDDQQGEPDSVEHDTVAFTIANVAPTLSLVGNATVAEGTPYRLTFGSVSDPGADTVTEYIVDWGDGATDAITDPDEVVHTYAESAVRHISLSLVDEDGTHADVATKTIAVYELTSIGDAPNQLPRGNPTAWSDAWTKSGVAIGHKSDYSNATDTWSAVSLTGLGATTLTGGDLFGGDLGVSGQTAQTSAIKQEIDGTEALRFSFEQVAHEAKINLTRFYLQDDESFSFAEAGRLQAFNGDTLVETLLFTAERPDGQKQVSLAVDEGFDSLVLTAGAEHDNQFVFGQYNHADGTFGADPFNHNGLLNGSDFLVDRMIFG